MVAFCVGGSACAGDGREAAPGLGAGTTTAGTSTEAGTLEEDVVDETPSALLGRFPVEERGGGSGYRAFRHDFARDARDNVTEFLFTYEDQLDLQAPPSSAPYMSTDYSNVYDADGRLVEHTVTADVGGLGASVSYTHDALGRCETTRVERTAEVRTRHREYDDAGRLSRMREEVTSGVGSEYEAVTTFGYDEQGRMTSTSAATRSMTS